MNFIKRSLLSLWKHRVRAILLIIAFGVIGTMLFTGLALGSSVNKAESTARFSMNAQVHVTFDDSKGVNSLGVTQVPLSNNLLKKLDSLPNVTTYNHLFYVSAQGVNFKTIYDETMAKKMESDLQMAMDNPSYSLENEVVIVNATDTSKLNEFSTGTYRLLQGRHLKIGDKDKNVAIIENQIAVLNHFRIGNQITVKDNMDPSERITFTIIGIYKAPDADSTAREYYNTNPSDKIYVPFNVGASLEDQPAHGANPAYHADSTAANDAYYYLDEPAHVTAFENAAKKIPGMENYLMTTNTALYQRVTSSLQGENMLSSFSIPIMLAAGCLILALVTALSLRDRRREFGILLAVGEKKRRILEQVFVETILPVFIAFCLAFVVSGIVSQKISDKMVVDRMEVIQKQDKTSAEANFLGSSSLLYGQFQTNSATPIEKTKILVTPGDVGKFAGYGLLIVLVSVLVPVVSVIRLSPMAVLSKKE